jgi:hypothetical protein
MTISEERGKGQMQKCNRKLNKYAHKHEKEGKT